ncbi:hypothetical protein AK812_SmicGene47651, partial [Symbiodinium microadriaticum]
MAARRAQRSHSRVEGWRSHPSAVASFSSVG